MRIVLDTGIFVSALITSNTPPAMLYNAWCKGRFELATSLDQLEELTRVLSYPKLERYIQPDEAISLLHSIDAKATVIRSIPNVDASPDPDDNKILATAIAAKADYLISGDKPGLLALKSITGIPIITARTAIDTLSL